MTAAVLTLIYHSSSFARRSAPRPGDLCVSRTGEARTQMRPPGTASATAFPPSGTQPRSNAIRSPPAPWRSQPALSRYEAAADRRRDHRSVAPQHLFQSRRAGPAGLSRMKVCLPPRPGESLQQPAAAPANLSDGRQPLPPLWPPCDSGRLPPRRSPASAGAKQAVGRALGPAPGSGDLGDTSGGAPAEQVENWRTGGTGPAPFFSN